MTPDPNILRELASPEALDTFADALAGSGDTVTASVFRAMAANWRATEAALHQAQAENSRMAQTIRDAARRAASLEAAAASTVNVLGALGLREQAVPA